MGKACGYTEKTVTDILSEILDSSPDAIETAADEIPASFPSQIADTILHGLAASVEKLKSGY
jgi:hypothetical protein